MSTTLESSAEHIRSQNISRERAAKSIALLYYMGTVAWAIIAVVSLFVDKPFAERVIVALVCAVLTIVFYAIGRGLQALNPLARKAAIVLAFPQMCGFPVGTVIGIYVLYTLMSRQGKRVFSEEYANVVAQTPAMDELTETSPIVKILLWVLVIVILFVAIIVLLAKLTS